MVKDSLAHRTLGAIEKREYRVEVQVRCRPLIEPKLLAFCQCFVILGDSGNLPVAFYRSSPLRTQPC